VQLKNISNFCDPSFGEGGERHRRQDRRGYGLCRLVQISGKVRNAGLKAEARRKPFGNVGTGRVFP
jgi:hypothetical protein